MSSYGRGTEPLYWQVAHRIMEGIQDGTWEPGDKLPSEHALCDMYQVSQITVRRALRELAHQSRVYSRHGLGWYVEDEPVSSSEAGGRPDVAILTSEPDALLRALIDASISCFGPLGQTVETLYYPPGLTPRQVLSVLPAELNGVPLLWAVQGSEEGLAERYGALTTEYAARSVLFGRAIEGLDLPAVGIDEQAAMAQVTQHMIAQGHRRIAYIGTDPLQVAGWRRYSGFAASMWDHGLELALEWVFSAGDVESQNDDRFDRVMGGSRRPTAVVCSSDTLAVEVIHRLSSVGLVCPSDVAVAGMGDEPFGAYLIEPLTTFRFGLMAAARQAVAAVADLSQGKRPVLAPLTGELVVRTSCGAGTGHLSQDEGARS